MLSAAGDDIGDGDRANRPTTTTFGVIAIPPRFDDFRGPFVSIPHFKLYCDLETRVRGHSRSSKAVPFDRAHTTYSSSIVNMPLSITVFETYIRILVENRYPLIFGAPLGVKPSDLRNNFWWRKTRMMCLSDRERISMICSAVLIHCTLVTDRRTDRQTGGIAVA